MGGQMTNYSLQARRFIEKLETGVIKKNYLSNHGKNFTGGSEQLAEDAFMKYEGSCGRKLMQLRLAKKGRTYVG